MREVRNQKDRTDEAKIPSVSAKIRFAQTLAVREVFEVFRGWVSGFDGKLFPSNAADDPAG
jgi:hypothetical protein